MTTHFNPAIFANANARPVPQWSNPYGTFGSSEVVSASDSNQTSSQTWDQTVDAKSTFDRTQSQTSFSQPDWGTDAYQTGYNTNPYANQFASQYGYPGYGNATTGQYQSVASQSAAYQSAPRAQEFSQYLQQNGCRGVEDYLGMMMKSGQCKGPDELMQHVQYLQQCGYISYEVSVNISQELYQVFQPGGWTATVEEYYLPRPIHQVPIYKIPYARYIPWYYCLPQPPVMPPWSPIKPPVLPPLPPTPPPTPSPVPNPPAPPSPPATPGRGGPTPQPPEPHSPPPVRGNGGPAPQQPVPSSGQAGAQGDPMITPFNAEGQPNAAQTYYFSGDGDPNTVEAEFLGLTDDGKAIMSDGTNVYTLFDDPNIDGIEVSTVLSPNGVWMDVVYVGDEEFNVFNEDDSESAEIIITGDNGDQYRVIVSEAGGRYNIADDEDGQGSHMNVIIEPITSDDRDAKTMLFGDAGAEDDATGLLFMNTDNAGTLHHVSNGSTIERTADGFPEGGLQQAFKDFKNTEKADVTVENTDLSPETEDQNSWLPQPVNNTDTQSDPPADVENKENKIPADEAPKEKTPDESAPAKAAEPESPPVVENNNN